jgi:hypothetical protein
MSKNTKSVRFNCFSPPVMLATLTVESVMTVYTVWRYKMNELTRLVTTTLVCLATFQLSEFFVCTGYGLRAEQWSRVGFVMITALPPLGIHIMHKLANKPNRRLVYSAYATMAAFMVFFLTYSSAFIGHQCTGNYVIFQMGPKVSGAYALYYYGWLATGIGVGAKWANEFKAKGASKLKKLETVRGLIIGYLVFLVPTATSIIFKPDSTDGIPSIMCGFAVIFALILTFYILPRAGEQKESLPSRLKSA